MENLESLSDKFDENQQTNETILIKLNEVEHRSIETTFCIEVNIFPIAQTEKRFFRNLFLFDILQDDCSIFNDQHIDWIENSRKPDVFSTNLRADLPVVRHQAGYLSFRENFLTNFHRRTKLLNNHHPMRFRSSSNMNEIKTNHRSSLSIEQNDDNLLDSKSEIG